MGSPVMFLGWRNDQKQLESPDRNQSVLPVGIFQAGIADDLAGRGGVDETFVVGIDADMGDFF